jgi:hypothetical protein
MPAGGFFVSAKSGENVVKTMYRTAAEVAGVTLTDYELGFHDKVGWGFSIVASLLII